MEALAAAGALAADVDLDVLENMLALDGPKADRATGLMAAGGIETRHVVNRRLRRAGLSLAAVALVVACQGPVGTAFPSSESRRVAVPDADGASVLAVRLASIRGPFNIREIKRGTYADLWRGSTNDALGASAADAAAKAQLVVWRVDLQGPTGSEEVYVDEATGALADSIVEGQ